MATLTDRYVDATLRGVPQAKRADIERELRASIADAIDARADSGDSSADAEVAVLTELGDPARLAAGYVVTVSRCRLDWCEVDADGYEGWIKRDGVWGVGPGEKLQ